MSERDEDAVLGAVLGACQLRARVLYNPRYCRPWHEAEPAAPPGSAWFHLIDTGSCRLSADGLPAPIRLRAGDFIMLTRGIGHGLSGDESEPPSDERPTALLCGEFAFASALAANPILAALPDVIVVPAAERGAGLRRIAELMLQESHTGGFGAQAVMDKLADVLFVMALRHFIATSTERRGLLAALADPRLARALHAMHAEPGRHWTVASLARTACLSRTVFAERFAQAMADGPYQYLTRLRMTEALRLLRDPRQSVAGIAGQLGYQTEAAFRRSFKRIHGYAPGVIRRGQAPG